MPNDSNEGFNLDPNLAQTNQTVELKCGFHSDSTLYYTLYTTLYTILHTIYHTTHTIGPAVRMVIHAIHTIHYTLYTTLESLYTLY